MEIPAPLMSGTITYFVLTLLAVFAGIGMGVTGKMDKENASYHIYTLVVHDGPLPVALLGMLLAAPVAHPRGSDVPERIKGKEALRAKELLVPLVDDEGPIGDCAEGGKNQDKEVGSLLRWRRRMLLMLRCDYESVQVERERADLELVTWNIRN